MKNVQIKATRVTAGIVRDMLRADPHCCAEAVVDARGMRVEWVSDEGDRMSRGWFFNDGGWSANRRNAADIRRWCVGG